MGVTTQDIADRLGVSRSTVSRALQGRLVSPATIDMVRKAAEELGYRPNFGARVMASGRTGMYGVMLARAANPYFGRVIELMQERALADGQYLAVGCYMEDIDRYQHYIELFVKQRYVDGLVIFPMMDGRMQRILAEIRPDDIPVVLMGRTLMENLHYVRVDHERGWYLMTKHLLELGHRRIGLIMNFIGRDPRDLQPTEDERFQGFTQAMQEYGVDWSRDLMIACKTSIEEAQLAAEQLLSRRPRPTAIFTNDMLALGVTGAARRLGLRIPEDLSVAGYDNTEFARFMDLTTMENLTDVVEAPLKILQQLRERELAGRERQRITMTLTPTLVVRSSTAPCPEG